MKTEKPFVIVNFQADIHSGRKTQHHFLKEDDECPMGALGDRLWLKEAYVLPLPGDVELRYTGHKLREGESWLEAKTMPRWACRTVLEIQSVDMVRLHGITGEEAWAWGLSADEDWRQVYHDNWEHTYGIGSWRDNPWVWVVAFERLLFVN